VDVVVDGVVEQESILGNHAQSPAEGGEGDVTDVLVIDLAGRQEGEAGKGKREGKVRWQNVRRMVLRRGRTAL
jgi:hypothetical protein